MSKQSNQRGVITVSAIVAVVSSVLLVLSLVFGISVFASKQSLQKNFDLKVDEASSVAVKVSEAKKDADYAEKDKSPTRAYNASSVYGSLSFNYPKSYSAYVAEGTNGGVPLDGYFQPGIVPLAGPGSTFALRFQIINVGYDQQVKDFDSLQKIGKVSEKPFRAANVNGVLGTRIEGEIANAKQGTLILLPLRDKTLRIWTEGKDYVADFDKYIVPSLNFVP